VDMQEIAGNTPIHDELERVQTGITLLQVVLVYNQLRAATCEREGGRV
jgi:hypothetical protein